MRILISLLAGATALGANPTLPPAPTQTALERDVINAEINRHRSDIRDCYDAALRRDAKCGGEVHVKMIIGRDGRVKSATTVKSTASDTALGGCLTNHFRAWRFPTGSASTQISDLPITFIPPKGTESAQIDLLAMDYPIIAIPETGQ